MKYLTRADEILLVVILALDDQAYSRSILDEMKQRVGKAITVGSLWVSLDGLAERGLIRKKPAKGAPPSGGRPRIYYGLTPKGTRALRRSLELHDRLWDGVRERTDPGDPS